MSIEVHLRAYLAQAVTAPAGIWLNAIPQGVNVEGGALTMQRIATERSYALDGPVGLIETTFQLDCWAARAIDVMALSTEVVGALHMLADGGTPWVELGGARIHTVKVTGERDIDEPEVALHRRSLTVAVTHTEG